ncbi:hypothetical protein WJX79_009287 [Trebouxia sp. C0005]|nr:MAG: ribosome biogenesis GTP-binding [Trebouxia sp. A1-2]
MLNSLPIGTARPSRGSRVAASKQTRVDSHGVASCSGRQRSTHFPSHGRQSLQPCRNTRLRALTQDITQSYLSEQDLFGNEEVDTSLQKYSVQWYPGHIARAERQLKSQLKLVDVVLEVRDARIPLSSCHPQIPVWCLNKPRLLIMNRADMISQQDQQEWSNYYGSQGLSVFNTDANNGKGITKVTKAALSLSKSINDKRKARGLQPRPVRAAVIGFPNVGKSALINRFLNRRVCESAPKPGVTKSLRWLRVGGDLDLLDAPGVLPMSFNDQIAAERLAICNDIGEAAYVNSSVAAVLMERLRSLPTFDTIRQKITRRLLLPFEKRHTGEDYVSELADFTFHGDKEQAALRIINQFRQCQLGKFALELPKDVRTRR